MDLSTKPSATNQLEIAANNRAIVEKLTELGGGHFTVDEGVTYHQNGSQQIVLPKGMAPATGAKALMAKAQADKETVSVNRTFLCTPGDGAVNFQRAIKQVCGIVGIGKPTMTMFGPQPPETIEVVTGTGPNDRMKVPWGRLDVPPLEGAMYLGAERHKDYGFIFNVACEVPKKMETAVLGLFKIVEGLLETDSIYLGKTFVGVGTDIGSPERTFMDPYRIKREEVVYADNVYRILDTEVWGVIRMADVLQGAGQPVNTKHLLYGPYGTGKTLAGALTAQVAQENGWTTIQCHTGKDDIEKVIRWAKLYAKSNRGVVIFVEDIDVLIDTSEGEDKEKMSRMMDLFDGFDSKNNRVMMVMTSNHLEAFDAPFTRQGRFDNLIHVDALDKQGVERLLYALFPEHKLAADLDFEQIYTAMEGYEPAFIRGSFNRVVRSSIVRTGKTDAVLTTKDFVVAAEALREQHNIHSAKIDKPKTKKDLGHHFREAFKDVLGGHYVDLANETGRIAELEDVD